MEIKKKVWLSFAICVSLLAPNIGVAMADEAVKVALVGESMEKMGIKLDRESVKAGTITFQVTNEAMKTGHEMIVVKLESKDQTFPIIASSKRVDEKALRSLGEVSNLKPGAQGTLTAMLKPGDYMLICNIKGHYQAGMYTHLSVTN